MKWLSYDGFAKTADDVRVRTNSGGIVTIVSLCAMFFLVVYEWFDYRLVEVVPELVVDRSRGEKMEINMDITFAHMPCAVLSLDVLDESGEIQEAISHGLLMTRLAPDGEPISSSQLKLEAERDAQVEKPSDDPNYCGPCYGARPDTECCNTCADVREAYRQAGWAFYDGSGIEQCESENIGVKLEEQKDEGCNVQGHILVNKVIGNFHFAPGSPTTIRGSHTHDLSIYKKDNMHFTWSHHINELSFGSHAGQDISNPLNGVTKNTDNKYFHYQYFVKIVATRFEYMNGTSTETNQYAVTSHERPIQGGRDEDHPNTAHGRGGIPGVYFTYDISPMKVINKEQRTKSFTAFLAGVCSIVGAVLAVASVIDRGIYEADKAIQRKKNM